jgi:AcrR family transcriptional regulator
VDLGGANKPALGLRERRKRATRQALSQAALTLVAEHGLEHVTVETISEAAGVSERTFFNYFATKEDALVGDPAEDFARICAQVLSAEAGISALEAVQHALSGELTEIHQHPDVFELRMTVLERNPSLFPRMMADSQAVIQQLTAAVAERTGVPEGHLFPGLLAFVAASAFHATLLKWHTEGRPGLPEDALAQAFHLLKTGFPDPVDSVGNEAARSS